MMSRTLNLADRVLALGRNFQELGRDGDALRLLDRLASWRELPAEIAEQTHARLAEIHLRHSQYAQACRHLEAVLGHRPENARYHYRLAVAFDGDKKSRNQIAYEHYRRSLELDPTQVDCLSDFGLLALKVGKEQEGLRALRRAVELAPDDPNAVGKLADGLRRCGRLKEAERALRRGLFRNPRSGAFHKLWNDMRFQRAYEAQQAGPHYGDVRSEMDEPVLLPYLRLSRDGASETRHRQPARIVGTTQSASRRVDPVSDRRPA
jgi:tetratricopeptide (TPR) repeat protein